ncbi:MAG: class SAM-dependent methyltransferase, partial [Flaviaesturariibacter sp.]|nr:class SAM-dependent methyltransferase [Flaviaesturariibacter sp.]
MSSVAIAYNQWSETYDAVENRTRDLDQTALQTVVGPLSLDTVLELGCGTGKNTSWLMQQANSVLAVDFSEGMLLKAAEKISGANVRFQQADITKPWGFGTDNYDLATCNLILEHIEDLAPVFSEAAKALKTGGY